MQTPTLDDYRQAILAHMNRQDWATAAATAAACRAAWPQDPSGWLLGSFIALLADQKDAALALMDERLAQDPSDLQCLLQRAECLLALGRRDAALMAAEHASVSAAGVPDALDAVGSFLVHADAHTRAKELYDAAIVLAPNRTDLLGKRAIVQRFLGDFLGAARDYDAVLALDPRDASAYKERAELTRQSPDNNAIAAMDEALAITPADSKDAATLHFALAKSHEDLGNHSAAWHHLRLGNAIERAFIRYDPRVDRDLIEQLIATFRHPESTVPAATVTGPVFIVGLPRSGTTLVERVLGSHSRIHAAGELTALSEALTAVMVRTSGLERFTRDQYIGALGSFDPTAIRDEYLKRSAARRGDKMLFTDKQPTNFYYCPLILRAFPGARIVHVTRHPLAACHAIYKTRFQGTYPFSYDIDELGDFYIGYRRLMAHWHAILPGRILDLAYEDLVKDQESTTRRLLGHLDLAMEPACLEFHSNAAATTTASAVQVRQPLYDSSVHQWKHQIEALLPLRRRLEAAGIVVE
jgi:tetratricopeptide (TPR) repeat protein